MIWHGTIITENFILIYTFICSFCSQGSHICARDISTYTKVYIFRLKRENIKRKKKEFVRNNSLAFVFRFFFFAWIVWINISALTNWIVLNIWRSIAKLIILWRICTEFTQNKLGIHAMISRFCILSFDFFNPSYYFVVSYLIHWSVMWTMNSISFCIPQFALSNNLDRHIKILNYHETFPTITMDQPIKNWNSETHTLIINLKIDIHPSIHRNRKFNKHTNNIWIWKMGTKSN